METLNSLTAVNELLINALFDITTVVRRYRESLQNQFLSDLVPAVHDTILYVREHVEQPLSVQSIASTLGYSRTYLSKLFSDTFGFCLRYYIYRCKLEESKFLLTYTEKSLSEISEYLCFSSQSHFQMKFKKAFHITPGKYRKKKSAETVISSSHRLLF
jgi:AraC-like DNA-binding protein